MALFFVTTTTLVIMLLFATIIGPPETYMPIVIVALFILYNWAIVLDRRR